MTYQQLSASLGPDEGQEREHRWAIPLEEAIMSANGEIFAQGIVRPVTLVAVRAELGAAIEAADEYERLPA